MKAPRITPETMEKAWKLHEQSVDDALIAETLGLSYRSTKRIIQLMTTAKHGGDIDSIEGENYKSQKEFAKKYFGIAKNPAPVEQPDNPDCHNADFRDFAVRVLSMIDYQNKLLERLLSELGIENTR